MYTYLSFRENWIGYNEFLYKMFNWISYFSTGFMG